MYYFFWSALQAGPFQLNGVSGAETRDHVPPHALTRAVNLPYKSVLPWGRTGSLLSCKSPAARFRRVTCCLEERHICW